jgi:hypothetical protein
MTQLFFADFDGIGPTFHYQNPDALPAFGCWSIGGAPAGAGHWCHRSAESRFGGGYAGIAVGSPEFIDTPIWLISPQIDLKGCHKLSLSADIFHDPKSMPPTDIDQVTVAYATDTGETAILEVITAPTEERKIWSFLVAKGSHRLLLLFHYYSSIGPPKPGSPQLDNIELTGINKPQPPHNFGIQE